MSVGSGQIENGAQSDRAAGVPPDPHGLTALAEAAALGQRTLASMLARTDAGITVVDADRRYVYANPAARHMLGRPLGDLRAEDFLRSFPAREHTMMLAHLPGHLADAPAPFTCLMSGADGAEREIVCSLSAISMAGQPHAVASFRDLTATRAAARNAVALAQTAAQLTGSATTGEILASIARQAYEATRALSAGIVVVGDDHNLAFGGGYGPGGLDYGDASPAWNALLDPPGQELIEAMSAGAIRIAGVPGKPVVLPYARSDWEADPLTRAFALTMRNDDWQGAVCVPLSWENRVIGLMGVYLPARIAGPSEAELALYAALADQAAVAVTNARLTSQARQGAALLERTRLARDLHDSVSQALFSMTMQARAAQLSMAKAGRGDSIAGRSVGQLVELTRGALAEMRVLLFELRPGGLEEEGLVAALGKQAGVLTTREQIAVTVEGPAERLVLPAGVEEHLYRIVSEALHNVVKHAQAGVATVNVTHQAGVLQVAVSDDGAGFDADAEYPGHLGLSTMAQRASAIGAGLTITSVPGAGTTVTVSYPTAEQVKQARSQTPANAEVDDDAAQRGSPNDRGDGEAAAEHRRDVPADRAGESAISARGGHSRAGDGPRRVSRLPADPLDHGALADAAALGLPALAGMLASAQDGITVVDADRRYVYANTAACRVVGHPVTRLRGQDFLRSFPPREHATMLEHLPGQAGEAAAPFTCAMLGSDGAEREVVCSTFAIDIAGSPHAVATLQDLTGPRVATRTAVALAQTTAQLTGTATTDEILAGIARHAVEGTRAMVCGIAVVGDDHKIASVGAHSAPGYGLAPASGQTRSAAWDTFADVTGEEVVEAMTAGSITIGDVPGKPVVLPDARSGWEASPVTRAFAATLKGLNWQAGVYVPLSWENQVFGLFGVYLPSGLAGPSEAKLAFYTALAGQAAVAVTNARLASQAGQAAALLERTRLARDLHDSVSQALFSMTMHARAAQVSMARTGVADSPAGRSVARLAELTRGALAEMRALIFELRPGALEEEGLVAALRKQGVALTAREQVAVSVDGPEPRLGLPAEVEEHLYRIVSEALHNVVKHAQARVATVIVTDQAGVLRVAVSDDGAGFDTSAGHPGHLGLSTMAQRAQSIKASLTVTSAPGAGTTVTVSLPRDRPTHGKAA